MSTHTKSQRLSPAGYATFLLLVLLIICDARENEQCPQNCICNRNTGDGGKLSIHCPDRKGDDGAELSRKIDRLLSIESMAHLNALAITNTSIRDVPQSICRFPNLKKLVLDFNRLNSLPNDCFNSMTKLQTLSASYNNITELQDGLLNGLDELQSFSAMGNRITSIGLRLFSNRSELVNLKFIRLEKNCLTDLEPWPLIRELSYKPKNRSDRVVVSLKYNSLSSFTNKLRFKYICSHSSALRLDLHLEHNRIEHISDIFNGWGYTSPAERLCLFLYRGGEKLFKIHIRDNPMNCDCVDFAWLKYSAAFQHTDLLHQTFCYQPPELAFTEVTRVPLIKFVCELKENCPSACKCVYRPANATLHIYCSRANITSLPYHLPQLNISYVKYKLDFSHNPGLRRLECRSYFSKTFELDASHSGIEFVEDKVWDCLGEMSRVILRGNLMSFLPPGLVTSATKPSSSTQIDLSHNPWICSCQNDWMLNWFKTEKHRLINTDGILCAGPKNQRGRNALMVPDDICSPNQLLFN